MTKHIHASIVATALALTAASCGRGRHEEAGRTAGGQGHAEEPTITSAMMRVVIEEDMKLREAHAGARRSLQLKLDGYERGLAAAKVTAPRHATTAIAELEVRTAKAKASLDALADDASPRWDAMRRTAEDDLAAVGDAAAALERALAKE